MACGIRLIQFAPSAFGRTGMVGNGVRIAVVALALLGALAARADYEAGQRAWDAGRPAEALVQWQAAAGSGDRRAMLALGRMYRRGLGVLQDYVEAHTWLNLAASRGEAAAAEERDALAAKMTPQQVAAAQERAAAWRPSGTAVAGTDRAQREAAAAPAVPAAAPRADSAPESTPPAGPPPPRAIREGPAIARRARLRAGARRREVGRAHRAGVSNVSERCRLGPDGHVDTGDAACASRARDAPTGAMAVRWTGQRKRRQCPLRARRRHPRETRCIGRCTRATSTA